MVKKKEIKSFNKCWYSRREARKSIIVSVKISPRDKQLIDVRKGDVPTSTFLRQLAVGGDAL